VPPSGGALMAGTARPLRIGLTGGIASGKSTVAAEFARLGVPVIDTDQLARVVSAPGEAALVEISSHFGPDILLPDGQLDRAALRQRVFADPAARKTLEGILHPRIREATEAAASRAGGPYQLIVVPLLFESGFDQLVDRSLVVDCPEKLQRERLLARDGGTPEHAARMLAAQLSRTERLARADDILPNTASLASLRTAVDRLHHRYLALAASGQASAVQKPPG